MGVRVVGWRRHGMPDDDAIPGFKHDGQGTRRGTRATAPAQIASTARWLCRSLAIAVDVVSLARLRVDARHAARHLATGASRRSTLASGREPSRQRCGRPDGVCAVEAGELVVFGVDGDALEGPRSSLAAGEAHERDLRAGAPAREYGLVSSECVRFQSRVAWYGGCLARSRAIRRKFSRLRC
jgi:hypothetical protein